MAGMARRRVDVAHLEELQHRTASIRNVCILAHVDHGKTTLSDGLVCSNGIISNKMAGKLRFLDSTEDEQIRGITMHSSAISLLYTLPRRGGRGGGGAAGDKAAPVSAAAGTIENRGLPTGGAEAGQAPSPPPPLPSSSSSSSSPSSSSPSEAASVLPPSPPPLPSAKEEAAGAVREKLTLGSAEPGDYLINLIDSPGHIDFSADVSTATRLCDAGLVVVDALEGVCPQTHAVFRAAWRERMRPLLVLNKVDRLITELRLTPLEAWQHLQRLIENINALTGSLVAAENMEALRRGGDAPPSQDGDEEEAEYLSKEAIWAFQPEAGNVVFASALDGWAFDIGHFVRLWAKRIGCAPKKLRSMMWGEWVFNSKNNKVSRWSPSSKAHPMFVTMILEPIWRLYDVTVQQGDSEKAVKMAAAIGVEVTSREIKAKDKKLLLQSIMRQWLPLSDAVLRMVVELSPSPAEAQGARMPILWPAMEADYQLAQDLAREGDTEGGTEGGASADDADDASAEAGGASTFSWTGCAADIGPLQAALRTSTKADQDPVVIFVSKMVPVKRGDLMSAAVGDTGARGVWRGDGWTGSDPTELTFTAFARVFSGTLKPDTKLFVMGPKYHPLRPETKRHMIPLDCPELGLYIMMGASLEPVSEVPAGNVVAIAGLPNDVNKCATLSTTPYCPGLSPISLQSTPMVRVAVYTKDQADVPALEWGLHRLYQADPAVEVSVTERGEHVLCCLGELHLEQCLKDLREQYAKVCVNASEPLISFRESIIKPSQGSMDEGGKLRPPNQLSTSPWSDEEGLAGADYATGTVRAVTPNQEVAFTVRCCPLPSKLCAFMDEAPEEVKALMTELRSAPVQEVGSSGGLVPDTSEGVAPPPPSMHSRFLDLLQEVAGELEGIGVTCVDGNWAAWAMDHLLAFGPRNGGANLLVKASGGIRVTACPSDVPIPLGKPGVALPEGAKADKWRSDTREFRTFENGLATGFQMATLSGPLASEEMYGVVYVVEALEATRRALGLQQEEEEEKEKNEEEEEEGKKGNGGGQEEEQQKEGGGGVLAANDARVARFGPLSGQVISTIKTCCRAALLSCPVRLVEAFYKCSLQCEQQQLGKMYAVLARRRGRVLEEDVVDGTQLFLLSALLPVAESFGFAQELLKKTSGAGTAPQLSFSHWEALDMDPFWRPLTEEEREDEGEEAHAGQVNVARAYIDAIRERKGMASSAKLVINAEKQRNLSTKK